MSEEQLKAFLEAVKADAGLQEKLKGAANPDTTAKLAKEAGFDVSKDDWLKYQDSQTVELSDEDLEGVAGGWRSDQSINGKVTAGCGRLCQY
jgi:predicted ribosomally synthesized peptide with nif11-like leader